MMKEIFSQNNYTFEDVAKTTFESAWIKSTTQNQNKKRTTHTILRQGSLSGSGYAYPGIASILSEQSTDEQE